MADADPCLEGSAPPETDVVRRVWLVARRAVAGTARAAAFADFMQTACDEDATALSGGR